MQNAQMKVLSFWYNKHQTLQVTQSFLSFLQEHNVDCFHTEVDFNHTPLGNKLTFIT